MVELLKAKRIRKPIGLCHFDKSHYNSIASLTIFRLEQVKNSEQPESIKQCEQTYGYDLNLNTINSKLTVNARIYIDAIRNWIKFNAPLHVMFAISPVSAPYHAPATADEAR